MNKPDTEQATISFKDVTPVKRTNTATYLGILCNEKATQLPNLNSRLGKTSDTFNKLQLFWKHSNIQQKMKLRLFQANIQSNDFIWTRIFMCHPNHGKET